MRVLGNRKNLEYLGDAAKHGRLSHAYLITGDKGMGKKTFAYNAARAVLCERLGSFEGFMPCGGCSACKRSLSWNHPDIIRITHEKKNTLSVDEIRNGIVGDILIKPYYGPYKIYIIEDACLMQAQAQNALLKTIEEPPAYAVIFLLADNARLLLDTIRSRCVRLDMEPLEGPLIEAELKARGADGTAAREAAACAAGNLGTALRFLEDDDFPELVRRIADVLCAIKDTDAAGLFDIAAELAAQDAQDAADTVEKWFRDVLVIKAAKGQKLYFPGYRDVLSKQAERISYENLNNIFNETQEAQSRLRFNVNAAAVWETLLLRIRHYG